MILKNGDTDESLGEPRVTQLQNDLVTLGFNLRFGVDGKIGQDTLGAMDMFLRKHKRNDNDRNTVDADELALLAGEVARHRSSGPPGVERFIDLRRAASREHNYDVRTVEQTYGVCWHQTACLFGEDPNQYLRVGAHYCITRGGILIQLHDDTDVVVSANLWNDHCISVECDGWYPGLRDDPRSLWRPKDDPHRNPMSPTREAMATARAFLRWKHADLAARGGKLKALVAHRQSSGDRESDPGEEWWEDVCVPAALELGLTDGAEKEPTFHLGQGYPIPTAWNPDRRMTDGSEIPYYPR